MPGVRARLAPGNLAPLDPEIEVAPEAGGPARNGALLDRPASALRVHQPFGRGFAFSAATDGAHERTVEAPFP